MALRYIFRRIAVKSKKYGNEIRAYVPVGLLLLSDRKIKIKKVQISIIGEIRKRGENRKKFRQPPSLKIFLVEFAGLFKFSLYFHAFPIIFLKCWQCHQTLIFIVSK